MNFEYPDLAGSVHAVFDTQLPGAAIDPTQDSQEEQEVTGSGGLPPTSRRAEKAPARDPPSFGLFGASQDRTQDLFFPPTVGSRDRSKLPEPTSPLPYLVQLNASLPGRFESISHRFHDIDAALLKCNARIESVYRLHETLHEAQMEATNLCTRSLIGMQKEFTKLLDALNKESRSPRPIRPATPLPSRLPAPPPVVARPSPPAPAALATSTPGVPLVVITAPTQTAPAPAPAPALTTPSTRARLPRKSAEGPKNYVDKPLTPSPHSSPDPLNPPTVAGPSSYAAAAAAGGSF